MKRIRIRMTILNITFFYDILIPTPGKDIILEKPAQQRSIASVKDKVLTVQKFLLKMSQLKQRS